MRALEAAPDLQLVRRCVDVAELIAVAQTGDVAVAAVDLSAPGLDVEAVRAVRAAGVRVVGLGPADRASALGTDAVGAGDDVVSALRTVQVSRGDRPVPDGPVDGLVEGAEGEEPRAGLVVTVWSPSGAPGRSTVALALADAMARDGRRCVLVDADTYGGAQAQQLGLLDEVSGLMAACRVANQGHEEQVPDHLQVVREGLGVLTGLPRPDMWVHVRSAALERVLRQLADTHDTVVVDVASCLEAPDGPGGGRDQATVTALTVADVVVVVGRADPVGLTRLVRGLHDLRDVVPDEPVVVLNQVRDSIGWSVEQLASTVHRLAGVRPLVALPQDGPTVDTAALRGATLTEVDPRSALVASVRTLATLVTRVRPVTLAASTT
ncbi:MAG: P-loop NTPase [Propionibacteriales bacterium]|nr:P-loop NTPase [Propionibacteriales bacterium]